MTKNWPYSPGDTIKSANDNADKEGLATGENDYDTNSLALFRSEAFESFFVKDTAKWSVSSGRIGTMTAGSIYAKSTGDRVAILGIGSKTFTASQDTYVFINEQTAVATYKAVANGASAPTADSPYDRLNAIITTNATNITAIKQAGTDNTGRYVYNTAAIGKNTAASDLQGYIGESRVWRGPENKIPDGWLPEDGRALSRSAYAALFDIIGTLYGAGDGSTTFNIPKSSGRVTIGYDPSITEFNTIGKVGGSKDVTLGVDHMPNHPHGVYDPGHNHGTTRDPVVTSAGGTQRTYLGGGSGQQLAWSQGALIAGNGTGIGIYGAGGGQPHSVLQPYLVSVTMIRVS